MIFNIILRILLIDNLLAGHPFNHKKKCGDHLKQDRNRDHRPQDSARIENVKII